MCAGHRCARWPWVGRTVGQQWRHMTSNKRRDQTTRRPARQPSRPCPRPGQHRPRPARRRPGLVAHCRARAIPGELNDQTQTAGMRDSRKLLTNTMTTAIVRLFRPTYFRGVIADFPGEPRTAGSSSGPRPSPSVLQENSRRLEEWRFYGFHVRRRNES